MTPIGIIRTPFINPGDMPVQGAGISTAKGTVHLESQYEAGLDALETFSHVYLIYLLHCSSGFDLTVIPFLDDRPKGLFATRAPRRPNPIGLSIVRLTSVQGNVLHVSEIDVLDQTPLLDIKPYVPIFDAFPIATNGWLQGKEHLVTKTRSDDRFAQR